MAVVNLYSKRKRANERPIDDVFEYHVIPQTLRVQLIQMFEKAYRDSNRYVERSSTLTMDIDLFEEIVEILRHEYGKHSLSGYGSGHGPLNELRLFISDCKTDHFLDCVEIFCRAVESDCFLNVSSKKKYHDEINHRFLEAGIGYEYDKEIIRIDSKLAHRDVVKPVIKLLSSDPVFEGAENEFFSAFSHFKDGKNKEAIADALKAFESTMKAILTKRNWAFSSKDPASKLIKACLDNELIPKYLQTHITGLRSLLEGGIPTVRNRISGHGQGVKIMMPEDNMTSFALYMTAINIKYLIECDSDLPD